MRFAHLEEINERRRAIAVTVARQVRRNRIALAEAHLQIDRVDDLLQNLRVAREPNGNLQAKAKRPTLALS